MKPAEVAVLASLFLAACAPTLDGEDTAQEPVSLQVVFRGNQCNEAEERVIAIRDAASWSEWQRAQRKLSLGLPDEPVGGASDIDFSRSSVIVITMGTRPTAGYSIDLVGSTARQANGVITISVVWREPGPDAVVAQMLTSPCVAVTVSTARVEMVTIDKR